MNPVQENVLTSDIKDLSSSSAKEQWLDWWTGCSLWQKLIPILLVLGYWVIHFALGGFRVDHLAVAGLAFLYYGGPLTQVYFRFLLPFVLYLVLYDSQGYYADWLRGPVHVREPYEFDKTFFGIETKQGVLLPTQWLQQHTYPVLDAITGITYLIFIPVFIAVALYFRFGPLKKSTGETDREFFEIKTHAMMWGMFWLNLICCSTYYWYPAAPPWYVDLYGMGPAQLDVPASAAGAARFDSLFGITLFKEFYSRCPNVFGAIPSLHVAFPLLSVYFAFKLKSLRVFCVVFYLLISFSAVYLNHHYILDILWGSAYALLIAWIMDSCYQPRNPSLQST